MTQSPQDPQHIFKWTEFWELQCLHDNHLRNDNRNMFLWNIFCLGSSQQVNMIMSENICSVHYGFEFRCIMLDPMHIFYYPSHFL